MLDPTHSFRIAVDRSSKLDATVITIFEKHENGKIVIDGTFTPQQLKDRIEFLEKTSPYSEMPPTASEELRVLRCARDLLAEEEHNTAFVRQNNDAWTTKDSGFKKFVEPGRHLRSDTNRK